MDIEGWQVVAAIAVPVLGFLGALAARERDPALYRKLRNASTALKDVNPSSDAYKSLDLLVAQQAAQIREREEANGNREFKPISLVLTLLVTVLVAGGLIFLVTWVTQTWGTGWAALSVPALIIGAFFGLLLIMAAVTTVYGEKDKAKAGK